MFVSESRLPIANSILVVLCVQCCGVLFSSFCCCGCGGRDRDIFSCKRHFIFLVYMEGVDVCSADSFFVCDLEFFQSVSVLGTGVVIGGILLVPHASG